MVMNTHKKVRLPITKKLNLECGNSHLDTAFFYEKRATTKAKKKVISACQISSNKN